MLTVGKAIGAIQEGIAGARDLAETQSAVNVIFGDGAAAVNAFAANATTALGQTRNQALNAANTFATFGKSAGLGGDELVNFSTRLVGLSADLASFKNTTPEEAITAIGAALRGESEPIRRYGILLDDATLKNRALAEGIIDSIDGSLTPQQRVLAAQAEIFAQTADAQGDFARTSSGLANQQRITAATIEEVKTKIGNLLLPAVTAVTVFFNSKFLPVLEQRLVPALASLRDWFADKVVPVIRDQVVPVLGQLGDWLQTRVVPAVRDHLIPAVRAIAQWFGDVLVPNFRNYVLPVLGFLVTVIVDHLVPALWAIASVAVQAFGWLTGTSKGAEVLRFAIIGATAAIVAMIVVQKTIAFATKAWAIAQAALNIVMSLNPIGLVIALIGALVAAIIWVATKTTFFQDTWRVVWEFMKGVGAWFAGPFVDFFKGAWNAITAGLGAAKDWIVERFNDLVGFVTGLPGRITSAASGLWDGIMNAFRAALNWIIDKWNGLEFRVPSFSFLGETLGGFTLGVPDIPRLQRGGLVDRTGLAVVHKGELVGQVDQLVAALVKALERVGGLAGLRVENLNVRAYSDRFSIAQLQDDLALHGVH